MWLGPAARAGCAPPKIFCGKERAMSSTRPFAIVTGASSGIGLQLAHEAARRGYDLLIAADRSLDEPAAELRAHGGTVVAVEVDLATREGVETLYSHVANRRIDALLANAGHGLGRGFLE